jgi:hypothetical protein
MKPESFIAFVQLSHRWGYPSGRFASVPIVEADSSPQQYRKLGLISGSHSSQVTV